MGVRWGGRGGGHTSRWPKKPAPSPYSQLVSALTADGGWFWDFTRADALFQDSGGTTPISSLNDPVGRAVDVAQGVALTQATAEKRPLFKQGAGALFDGSNDGLASATAIDLSSTDEIMVIAGVRKLSDSARGLIASLSAAPGGNSGIFTLELPGSALVGYRSFIKGTVATQVDTGPIDAPDSTVLAIEGKISTDLARLRVDQGSWFNGSTDMGSGNFGNHTLYVGALGGSSSYLNGYITGLAIIPYIDDDLRSLAESVVASLNQGLPS